MFGVLDTDCESKLSWFILQDSIVLSCDICDSVFGPLSFIIVSPLHVLDCVQVVLHNIGIWDSDYYEAMESHN
jgi:hypothetical protein